MQIIFGLPAHFLAAKTSPPYMHTARRKKRSFQETQPRTSYHFSAMFFRKTRLPSRRCICIPQGARNAVLQETQPEPQIIFRRCFFRKTRLLSRRCICIPQGARNAVLRKNSPKNQISIMSASFFFAISSISLTYLSVIF